MFTDTPSPTRPSLQAALLVATPCAAPTSQRERSPESSRHARNARGAKPPVARHQRDDASRSGEPARSPLHDRLILQLELFPARSPSAGRLPFDAAHHSAACARRRPRPICRRWSWPWPCHSRVARTTPAAACLGEGDADDRVTAHVPSPTLKRPPAMKPHRAASSHELLVARGVLHHTGNSRRRPPGDVSWAGTRPAAAWPPGEHQVARAVAVRSFTAVKLRGRGR